LKKPIIESEKYTIMCVYMTKKMIEEEDDEMLIA